MKDKIMKRTLRHLSLHRGLLAAGLLGACSTAWACNRSDGDFDQPFTLNVVASLSPGTVVASNSGRGVRFTGCDGGLVHPLQLSLEPNGLRPVSTVDYRGRTYTTYELSPTSPLFFFPMSVNTSPPGGGNNFELFPAGNPTPTPVAASANAATGELFAYPYVGIVVRAGMQSVAETHVASEVSRHTLFPLVGRASLRVVVNVVQATCALRDASPTLRDVPASELGQPGDASRSEDFTVQMQCTGPGVGVRLTLNDALDAGSTGSVLTPTADSTAGAVRVQLLRNGSPVTFGSSWDHGSSQNGLQQIPLSARLQRQAGTFTPGLAQGQAVLTADYR